MHKILIVIFVAILLLSISATAQIDLHFNLKESLELPGNAVFNLKITDMNSDNYADYLYNDSTSIKVVDGSNLSIIFETALPPGYKVINFGDLNNDTYPDIAVCGVKPSSPDTGFAIFYLGPAFDSLESLAFELDLDYHEWPTQIFFNHLNSNNTVFIGKRRSSGQSGYYTWWHVSGSVSAFNFTENHFSLVLDTLLDGAVGDMQQFIRDSQQFMVIQTSGESAAGDDYYGAYYWYDWADLYLVDLNMNVAKVWHAGPMNGFNDGTIENLCVGAPAPGDDDYIYFYTYDTGDIDPSIICMDGPDSNIAWQAFGQYEYYNFVLTSITNRDYKDLFIFDTLFQLRDPWDGYLSEIGQLFGVRGLFQSCQDQDGDSIDEFYYLYSDSIYIYNSGQQTSINDEANEIPGKVGLFNNYPNPFNSWTQIKFELTRGSHLFLEIYDIQGRKIKTLVDQYLQAGNYSISWNPGGLASGVYFCRLVTLDTELTNKMVIIK